MKVYVDYPNTDESWTHSLESTASSFRLLLEGPGGQLQQLKVRLWRCCRCLSRAVALLHTNESLGLSRGGFLNTSVVRVCFSESMSGLVVQVGRLFRNITAAKAKRSQSGKRCIVRLSKSDVRLPERLRDGGGRMELI